MEIAIVDDQEEERRKLEGLLRTYLKTNGAGPFTLRSFASGEALLADGRPYDLIFLDIGMPGPDGMETARELRSRGFSGSLVFTTVLSEYVFDAFSVEAADFLVKPVDPDRLRSVLDRILARYGRKDRIVIRRRSGTTVVDLGEIEYCEVRGRRLFLHLRNQAVVDFYEKMDTFAPRAGERFFRCHRSYLVNMDCVSALADGQVQLLGGDRIPVSRLREAEFREALLRHLKRKQA